MKDMGSPQSYKVADIALLCPFGQVPAREGTGVIKAKTFWLP